MTLPTVFKRRRSDSGALVDDLSFLIHEPAEVYHAKRDKFLSSHQLAEFRRNPLLFHKKQLGLVKDEDRPAYLIGRAAHALILERREAYERPVRLRRSGQSQDRRAFRQPHEGLPGVGRGAGQARA